MLYFYHETKTHPDILVRFFSDLERLAASFMIRKANINKRIERYGRLMQLIELGDDIFAPNSPLQFARRAS